MMNEVQIKRWLKAKTGQWGYLIQRNECPDNIRPVVVLFHKTLREGIAICEWAYTPIVVTYNMKMVMQYIDDLKYLEDTVIHEVCHIPTYPYACEPTPQHNGEFTMLYRKYSAML